MDWSFGRRVYYPGIRYNDLAVLVFSQVYPALDDETFMIVYFILGSLVMLISGVLGLLPDALTFLPMPVAMLNAFSSIGETAHFFVYYFGEDVGDAFVLCFGITVTAGMFMMIWRILVNFRAPIVSRLTHGSHVKDI